MQKDMYNTPPSPTYDSHIFSPSSHLPTPLPQNNHPFVFYSRVWSGPLYTCTTSGLAVARG
jgi:hypothetical protein